MSRGEVHHYRGWVLTYDPPPIPVRSHDWQAVRDSDDTAISAGSYAEAVEQIDAIEDGEEAA